MPLQPRQGLQISGASVIAPSLGIPTHGGSPCLLPLANLGRSSQTPLTGRGCHGPDGPHRGRPGEQTRATLNRFIYLLKSAATAVRFSCAPLLSFLSLFGPVHSFFARPHPPSVRPLACRLALTDSHSLSRDTRRGLRANPFLNRTCTSARHSRGEELQRPSRDLDPFPKPPTTRDSLARRHLPLLLAAFTTRPESHLSCAARRHLRRLPLWLETRCQDVSLSESCRNGGATGSPGLRSGRSVLVQQTPGPVQGTYIVFQLWILDSDSPLTAVSTYCLRIELGGEFLIPTSASPLFNKKGTRTWRAGSWLWLWSWHTLLENTHQLTRPRSFP